MDAPEHRNSLTSSLPWTTIGTYIDTLAMRLVRESGDNLRHLREKGELLTESGSVFIAPSGSGRKPASHSRVLIHQPSEVALGIGDHLADRYGGRIQELHVALEVEAGNPLEAEHRSEYLARRIRRRWARGHWLFRMGDDFGAFYTSGKRWSVDKLVIYAGPSKLRIGEHCVRIERRMSGSRAVGNALRGMLYPSDILSIDIPDFWASTMSFEEADLLMLGRQERGRGRAKKLDQFALTSSGRCWYDNDLAIGSLISRRAALQFNEPFVEASALAIREACRDKPWFHASSSMKAISSPLVITRTNWSFPSLRK